MRISDWSSDVCSSDLTWAIVLADANRHALNFLATARQYADQLVRGFKHLDRSEPFSETADRLLSNAYDEAVEYQFVYELRNYLQHRSVAIHGMKGRGKDAPWAEGTKLYCQKKLILEDRGKFKLRVLEKLDDEIDMLFMFRGYMAQVSRVQFELRKQDRKSTTSELQSLMRISYAVFCLNKKKKNDRL